MCDRLLFPTSWLDLISKIAVSEKELVESKQERGSRSFELQLRQNERRQGWEMILNTPVDHSSKAVKAVSIDTVCAAAIAW